MNYKISLTFVQPERCTTGWATSLTVEQEVLRTGTAVKHNDQES